MATQNNLLRIAILLFTARICEMQFNVKIYPRPSTVRLGEPIELVCEYNLDKHGFDLFTLAVAFRRELIYKFKKEGGTENGIQGVYKSRIKQHGDPNNTAFSLRLPSPNWCDDIGQYSCLVGTDETEKKDSVYVQAATYLPHIYLNNEEIEDAVELQEPEKLDVNCSAQCDTAPVVHLFVNDNKHTKSSSEPKKDCSYTVSVHSNPAPNHGDTVILRCEVECDDKIFSTRDKTIIVRNQNCSDCTSSVENGMQLGSRGIAGIVIVIVIALFSVLLV